MTVCDLSKGKCKPCEGGVPPLTEPEIQTNLTQLKGWQVVKGELAKVIPSRIITKPWRS